MDIVQAMYVIVGIMFCFTIGIFVLVVAGKDILLAFKRWFFRTGCYVYIATPTRTISEYFKVPKDGVFRIKKSPYVTNPEKTMNLTQEEKEKIIDALGKKEQRISARIKEIEKKKLQIIQMRDNAKEQKQKFFLTSHIKNLEANIRNLKDKLRHKQENYFKNKRPAFFYIENDPIPKDFYEYYSLLDSKMVDNMVTRAASQPRSEKQDKDLNSMKIFIFIAVGAAALAAFLAFQNNASILEICRHVGASCGG